MLKTRARSTRLPVAALTAVLLLSLGACATTQSPASSHLSGHWQLDKAASDNLDTKVAQAINSAEATLRKRRGSQAGSASGAQGGPGDARGGGDENFDAPADQFGNLGAIGPDFKQLRDLLLQTLQPPSLLSIEVQPDVVEFRQNDLPGRDYRAGEVLTRFDEYGTARLDSRWSGKAFVVRESYTSGAQLTERYEVDPANGLLRCTRTLQDRTVGKIELKSVYRRS